MPGVRESILLKRCTAAALVNGRDELPCGLPRDIKSLTSANARQAVRNQN
jgi:hypothetical protein